MILQLNPPIPVETIHGPGIAHFLINEGPESHLKWVCFLDDSGECWTFSNPDIRAQKNITAGREYISPFYDPADVDLPKEYPKDHIFCGCEECGECLCRYCKPALPKYSPDLDDLPICPCAACKNSNDERTI